MRLPLAIPVAGSGSRFMTDKNMSKLFASAVERGVRVGVDTLSLSFDWYFFSLVSHYRCLLPLASEQRHIPTLCRRDVGSHLLTTCYFICFMANSPSIARSTGGLADALRNLRRVRCGSRVDRRALLYDRHSLHVEGRPTLCRIPACPVPGHRGTAGHTNPHQPDHRLACWGRSLSPLVEAGAARPLPGDAAFRVGRPCFYCSADTRGNVSRAALWLRFCAIHDSRSINRISFGLHNCCRGPRASAKAGCVSLLSACAFLAFSPATMCSSSTRCGASQCRWSSASLCFLSRRSPTPRSSPDG